MDRLAIRTATPADHEAVRDVRRRSSLSNEGDRDNLLANPETLEYDVAPLAEGRTRVAVADDRIVGFTTTRVEDAGLELESLFVDPEWTRNGVGRALVGDVVGSARRLGIARVNVAANEHALAFYESVGFVADGVVTTRFAVVPHMYLDVASPRD